MFEKFHYGTQKPSTTSFVLDLLAMEEYVLRTGPSILINCYFEIQMELNQAISNKFLLLFRRFYLVESLENLSFCK